MEDDSQVSSLPIPKRSQNSYRVHSTQSYFSSSALPKMKFNLCNPQLILICIKSFLIRESLLCGIISCEAGHKSLLDSRKAVFCFWRLELWHVWPSSVISKYMQLEAINKRYVNHSLSINNALFRLPGTLKLNPFK